MAWTVVIANEMNKISCLSGEGKTRRANGEDNACDGTQDITGGQKDKR